MDESASTTIVEQQNIGVATAQKSKKKSKNKKTNGKVTSANSSPNGVPTDADETMNNAEKIVEEVAGDTMNAANGLTKKFEQHLHIAGDGFQMNGITRLPAGKSNKSQANSHVAQNGYCHPEASVNTTETRDVGDLKKSKSKSNKHQNKETSSVVEFENNMSHQQKKKFNSCNEVSSLPATTNIINSTAALHKSTNADLLHLKNGFHVCMNDHDANVLPCKEDEQIQPRVTIKDFNKTLIETAQAQQMLNKNSKALNTTTATQAAFEVEAPAIVATSSIDSLCDKRLQQQTPTLATIATKHSILTTNANPPTATTQNTSISNKNEKTAKQDEDNNAQQAQVANSKTTTEEATLSVSTPSAVVSATSPPTELDLSNVHIEYKEYESELQMHDIMRLIQAELSEPYSIYTYRYFIYNWPKLCFLAAHGNEYVGAIVCKLDMHMNVRRGYIAMLAVRKEYRKLKIGTTLVQKAIEAMLADNADEVVLETEMRNLPALRLYENLGFVRDKRLFRYYLNGVDALRLKLWFR